MSAPVVEAVRGPATERSARYSEHRSVEDFVRQLDSGELVAPNLWRRAWPPRPASRFIESLINGLPVGEIFLFPVPDTDRRVVLDGNRRLAVLASFYRGWFGGEGFALTGVDPEIEGKTRRTLRYPYGGRLDESVIPTTILAPGSDESRSALHEVVARLHSDETLMRPQEIRTCLHQGSFNDLLGRLVRDDGWRRLHGGPVHGRDEEEAVLRFLALHNGIDRYRGPMRDFLDGFMGRHRQWSATDEPPFVRQFRGAVRLLAGAPERAAPGAGSGSEGAPDPRILDALLCGAARRSETGPPPDASAVLRARERLTLRLEVEGLASSDDLDEDSARRRIELAREAFSAAADSAALPPPEPRETGRRVSCPGPERAPAPPPAAEAGAVTASEDEREDDGDQVLTVETHILQYAGNPSIPDLVREMENGDLVIPKSRRTLRWSRARASRWIESLILGLPVPAVVVFAEKEGGRQVVADGCQRLLSILCFYRGAVGDEEFTLRGVGGDLEGRPYSGLSYARQRALDDALAPRSVFHQLDDGCDADSIHAAFEHLSRLRAQEIRSCLFPGPLDDLLSELAEDPCWRRLRGAPGEGLQDEEDILRFLALHNEPETCGHSMKRFLNAFMERNRNPNTAAASFASQFRGAARATCREIGPEALRPDGAFDDSLADAVLCGVAHRLENGSGAGEPPLRAGYRRLLERIGETGIGETGLGGKRAANRDRVAERIALAREAFAAS